eukprot:1899704-Amphidinium_carterae.1
MPNNGKPINGKWAFLEKIPLLYVFFFFPRSYSHPVCGASLSKFASPRYNDRAFPLWFIANLAAYALCALGTETAPLCTFRCSGEFAKQ